MYFFHYFFLVSKITNKKPHISIIYYNKEQKTMKSFAKGRDRSD